MRVNESESIVHPWFDNHFIQFGVSTWTENEQSMNQTESIRRAVYNNGTFSPHGSSEIPLNEMGMLIRRCIELDKININEMAEILEAISSSIQRQIR